MSHIYDLCCKYHGRYVEIRTVDGQIHRGKIMHVTNKEVFIQPINSQNSSGFGGFSYGWGFGSGFGIGIGLGAIASLALLPWFFI